MKKFMTAMVASIVLVSALAAVGCSDDQAFEAKSYSSGGEAVKSIVIDVEDRAVEVLASEDGQVHIEYSESEKEFYNISVSESGELTMTYETDKDWTDFIGTKPDAQYRTIKISVPGGLLSDLSIKTTNEAIKVSPLSVQGGVLLDSNGGDLNFEKLGVGKSLNVTAKNGNITGSVLGGMDDFSITCEYKKGDCNLPENKEGGSKSLKANCNNGDIKIDFIVG